MKRTDNIEQWRAWINTAKATGEDLVLLKAGHKGPHYDDWQNKQLGIVTLRDWAKQGGDAGLKCARFPTLDVDCDNQEVGEKVRDFFRQKNLNGYLDRRRDAKGVHRFAAIFRTEEPAPKQARTYQFSDTGEAFKLEFLGDGQQVKVLGTHDTPEGGSYFIEGGPRDLATLPEIGGADHRKLILDELEALLIAAFPTLERKSSSSGQVGARRHKKARNPADLDPANQTWDEKRVRELVAALPTNDFGDYDDAVTGAQPAALILAWRFGASGLRAVPGVPTMMMPGWKSVGRPSPSLQARSRSCAVWSCATAKMPSMPLPHGRRPRMLLARWKLRRGVRLTMPWKSRVLRTAGPKRK
jgi:hypothetical protein